MEGLFRRSRFVFGTGEWTTDVSARPWTPADNTIGGSRTSAAGIPASYIIRRDILVELTLRVGELEWNDCLDLVSYGQTSQTLTWFPDVDEPVSYEVYLESPLAGERWTPRRMGEYPRMFEVDLVLRNVAGVNPWKPYFEDAEDEVTDFQVVSVTASPNAIVDIPIGSTQEVTLVPVNAAVEVIPGTTNVFVSSDPSVATVSPDTGLVSAIGTGSATITGSADGNPVAVPVSVVAAPAGTLYFEDDQGTGNFAPDSGGYGWGDLSGGAFNPAPSVVADADSPTGFAVRFRFNATSGGSRTEARMHFGANLTDVYIGYSKKLPLNFYHRNGPSSDNNKEIRVWGNAYSVSEGDGDPGIKTGFSGYPSPSTGGGSFFNFNHETFGRTEGDGHKYTDWSPTGVAGINLSSDLGMYRRYVFHCKVASGAGQLDGEVELWIDGVLRWSKKDADLWDYSPVAHAYFDAMYFLGAANSGFNVVTDILIQGVKIGSTYSLVA